MHCLRCDTDVPGTTRFCPSCGTPIATEGTATEGTATEGTAVRTAVLPARERPRRGGAVARGMRARMGEEAAELARRYRALPTDVRLALVGALVTVVSFVAFGYADGTGTAAGLGGRLWWRPLLAVGATLLLFAALARPRAVGHHGDAVLAAVVLATAGVTEAGLFALVSGDARGAEAGFYGMLAGLVVVLVAAVRAARRVAVATPAAATSGTTTTTAARATPGAPATPGSPAVPTPEAVAAAGQPGVADPYPDEAWSVMRGDA